MKTTRIFLFCWAFCAVQTQAQSILTAAACRSMALQNSPLQQKKNIAATISALQLENLKSNNLPRISVNAQASYQSDAIDFPFSTPLGPLLTLPKDQYMVSVNLAERIYDGGTDRIQRKQRALDSDLAAAQVDVETYQVRELVTNLFFQALLLQESKAILKTAEEDLEHRKKQAEGAVAAGAALRSTVDQVQVQILKTGQQLAVLEADRQALLQALSKWTGKDVSAMTLQADLPGDTPPMDAGARPEMRLFALQMQQIALGKDALSLRKQPRVELFAQGGYAQPNPFNFFKTGFVPFGIVGLRATWTPVNWGNTKRDARVFDLQTKNISAQQQAFQQRFEAGYFKDQSDYAKWQAQLKQDDDIIKLQEDIVARADAQVKNGVMTATDYLTQLNTLTQARLTRKYHEIQAAQAREIWRAKTESD